ncbi:unnamed protein product, partial [Prorocentrum cordatum]
EAEELARELADAGIAAGDLPADALVPRLRGALQDAQEEADALQLRLASLQGEARAGRERSDATGALVLDLLARLAMSREQGAPDGSGPALLRDGG